MKSLISLAVVLLCIVALPLSNQSCTGGPSSESTQPDGGTPTEQPPVTPLSTYKACDVAKDVGGFRIELAADFTGVQGQVFNGVVPANVPEEVQSSGTCRLLKKRSLFCTPTCTPGNTCNEKATCIPYPTGQSMGKVTIVGLKSAISMDPREPIFFYTNTGDLPHPGFAAGADIQLSAEGGTNGALVLKGWGIGPLEVSTSEVQVDQGKPAEIKWTAPATPGPARISIKLNINNHGNSGTWIECLSEDTGSFSIPAELITKLFESGTSGFPDVTISRRTADSADIQAGCVQLLVISERKIPVKIVGLTSCSQDSDCPNGQTCKSDLTCGN